jgi:hypothetical protein
MSTLKDTLCLVAILIAYGMAGRMDYDDAVMQNEARQAAVLADCPTSRTLTSIDPPAQAQNLPFDPQDDGTDANAPEGDVPCASHML